MQDLFLLCRKCTTEETQEFKLFKKHVVDIVCTVKRNPIDYLEYANFLYKKLKFSVETSIGSGCLVFPDLNINVIYNRKKADIGIKKMTAKGIILNFRSCAPLQQKKKVIQWSVHKIFNRTSDWQSFDVALKKIRGPELKSVSN